MHLWYQREELIRTIPKKIFKENTGKEQPTSRQEESDLSQDSRLEQITSELPVDFYMKDL